MVYGAWHMHSIRPERHLLVAGDKSGVSQKRFYRSLIRKADKRFAEHLNELENVRRRKWRRAFRTEKFSQRFPLRGAVKPKNALPS
jgi:hypothetical protein